MNDKGQSLVLFVFLIPLFIAIFAYVFDTCYIKINNNKLVIKYNNKLDNLSALAMNYVLKDKNKIEIEQLILDNDADIKIISITNSEVHIRKEVDSMFGSIIGIKKYSLDSIYNGYVDSNNKIRIKKG